MLLTVAPFSSVSSAVGAASRKGRRIGTQPLEYWSGVFFTPINASMQGIAAHVEATESEEAYFLAVDLPGFGPEDIDVQLQGDGLTISANKPENKGTARVSFSRSFTLPDNIKQDDISASLDKGVLTVMLPKAEPTPKPAPKSVTVQTGPAKATADAPYGAADSSAVAADKPQQDEGAARAQDKCKYRGWGRCSR